ncbi:unnamed protein product [Closterium sp. NIES-54]
MDVWGPARVSAQGRKRYFLLVVDDYTRYTTAFLFRSKGQDLPVLRLHSDRRGEFSSYLLQDFCRGEGILQSFTLPDSPQQNGIAERHIGLVMEVARSSMIHAAAPHFLWSFAVRYAVHQLNLLLRVSLSENSPTLRWTGEVGDASVFRVWGSHAFVCDTSADKLSARAIPCVFLGFVPDVPGWQFYHPTLRRVLPSQDVTFDELVPFYRLFPYCSAPPPPPPLFLAPVPPPVNPLPPHGPAPSGVSQVDPLPGTALVEVTVGLGAAPGAASGAATFGGAGSEGAGSGGAEPGGEEPRGAEPEGVEPRGAKSEGAESRGAEPRGAASSGGPAGASPRLSPQQQREWLVWRARLRSGAPRVEGAGDAGAGGAGVTAGAGGPGGTAAAGPRGARTRGTGAAGTGGVGGAGAGDPTEPGAAGAGGSCAGGVGAGGVGAGGAGVGGTSAGGAGAAGAGFVDLGAGGASGNPASPLPAPSPYTEQSGGLTERREPASRPVSPVRTARRAPRLCPPPVPGTHAMALRPSSVPLCVPLPAPPESSLLEVPDPESDRARAARPTVSCLITTADTDPAFESAAASALVAELLDFAAACRLDYATALVAESASASPPSVKGECALGTDVLEDSQRQGVDYFQTFSRTPKMTTLRVLLHVPAQRDYELHSLEFSTAFLQGSLHEEIWLRRPPGFTESFPAGTVLNGVFGGQSMSHMVHQVLQRFGFQFSSPQPTPLSTSHSLSAPPSDESVEHSGPYPEPAGCLMYLMTCTRPDLAYPLSLLARYVALSRHRKVHWDVSKRVLRYLCSTSGMGLVLGGRGPVVLTGHTDASWVDDSATQRSSKGYTFSLGSGSVSWRSTHSSSVLSSCCEAEIYAGAMAAQELRWLTYLLTDLGEQPRSPLVLYVDNKAMIALCQEHNWSTKRSTSLCDTFLLQSFSSVTSFVLRTWPLGRTLLIYSPRHFRLVIINASLLC